MRSASVRGMLENVECLIGDTELLRQQLDKLRRSMIVGLNNDLPGLESLDEAINTVGIRLTDALRACRHESWGLVSQSMDEIRPELRVAARPRSRNRPRVRTVTWPLKTGEVGAS